MDLEKADPALMKTEEEEEEEKEEVGDHSELTSPLPVVPPHDDKEKDESQPTSAVTCNPANSIETKSTEASPEVISTDSTTSPEVTSCNDVVTDPHVTSTAAGTSHDEAKTAPEMAPNLDNENSQKSPSSSPTFQEILDQNRDRCLLEMQPDSVLEELFQKGDITAEEYEEICRVPMRADRSAKLIGFLKESTVDTFHSFCTSLRNTDQLILAQALGAIGPIRVKIKLTSSVKQEGLKLIALGLLNDKARNTNVLRSGTSEARCTHVQTIDLGTVILTCQCHDMKALEELKLIYEDGSLTHMFESWAGLDEAGDDQRRYAVGVKVDVQIDPKEFHDVAEELKILEEAEIYREQQKAFILRQREKKAEEKAELNQRAYADVIIQMETTDLSEEALREMFAQAGPFIESDNESIDGVLVLPENIFVNSESLLHLAEIELTVLGLRWSSVTPLEIKSQLQRLIATKVLHKEPSDTELEIVTLNVKTCWGSEEASILKDTADHNSEDAENVRIKLLRIFLPTLTAFLPLEEFVYKIRVLTSADKEHVLFQQRRSGRSHAVTALMETLILRPCWYKEFLHTLEHMDTDDGKFILSVLAGCQNIPTQSMVKFLQKSDELLEVMRMAMTMGDENILKKAYEVVREGAKTAQGLYHVLTGAALGVGAGFVAAGLTGAFHGAVGGPVGMLIGGTLGVAAGAFYHLGTSGLFGFSVGSLAGSSARSDFTQIFCRTQDSGFDTKKFMERRTNLAKQIQKRQHEKLKKEFKMMHQMAKDGAVEEGKEECETERESREENETQPDTEEKPFLQKWMKSFD